VIDLHAHILPGIDDGPGSMEGAVELARAAVASGTTAMAATSHVSHMFPCDPLKFADRLASVRAALQAEDVPLQLVQGGEIAPSKLPDLDRDALEAIALGGGPYLLVECPFSPVSAELEPLVYDLQHDGWRILLAHPERSAAFHRAPERLARLVEHGALAQVTAGSLAGDFGQTARRFAIQALREGLVHVLASDAHDAIDRPPGMAAGLSSAERDVPGLHVLAEWLTEEVPAVILAGEEPPSRPPLPRSKGGLRARLRPASRSR
jgi:protein-tyrosine phosphatase